MDKFVSLTFIEINYKIIIIGHNIKFCIIQFQYSR